MARHRFDHPPFDQINLTPLIDTLFFLLIIFMLTAPLLEYSIDVHPPEYKAMELKPNENSKTVGIKRDGSIVFENQTVSPEVLVQKLIRMKKMNPKFNFYLRADGDLKYREVISVLRDIKKAGFNDISLITAAEDK